MNGLVLIVDDSSDTLSTLNEAVDNEGMETPVTLEGEQALSIARKMIPDIILLDAVMPSMSGFEVCEKLKLDPELRSIPIIFMTGLVTPIMLSKGLKPAALTILLNQL
ncbi:MAG: CheY-like chemotaxis protein [Cellvibrionaceae bacterium]|jgi:CheY-like chemotaxis protein